MPDTPPPRPGPAPEPDPDAPEPDAAASARLLAPGPPVQHDGGERPTAVDPRAATGRPVREGTR
ncbi:hypothetical protein K353_06281 [Kitasatospora sp. SolWspMP-SS2h]|uniref:hypothetical protein n=1 Tax=Kitasatospora sp. SolWspMP-SS2h TaxID=1305729 RepID=UPI000DB93EBC|nr:hypothetical protein [Kitasatospora sp. SolWspMP-SS2h]RAJ31178.1 hypothetical protein K353_06281 [Kitasatospora sp. SolWspMP-SS2h]